MTTPTEALAKVRDVLVNAFDYGVDTLIGNTPRNQLNLPLIKDALGLLPILEAAIKDAQDVRGKWHPISEAPTDGTSVLMYSKSTSNVYIDWLTFDGKSARNYYEQPSHFKYLPALPTEGE